MIVTVKEALDWFTRRATYPIDDKCKRCEAIAIKAIEKALPKKATFKRYKNSNEEYPYCPTCGQLLDYERYCYNCGQAMDWGDLE